MIGSMFVGFTLVSWLGLSYGLYRKNPLGWFGLVVWQLLGHWGLMLADTAILPSVLGRCDPLALSGIGRYLE